MAEMKTMEPLEPRRLLAANLATPWTIDGTAGADTIVVQLDPANQHLIYATVNGQVTIRPRASISRLTIEGEDGDDTISVYLPLRLSMGVWIYGDSGNDTINGGPERDHIYGGLGNDTINGGGGRDIIYANANDTVATEPKQILRSDPSGIEPIVPPYIPASPITGSAFSNSVNQFAADLYTQLRADNPNQNIFFSAYSIVSAFAMVYIGANGATRQQMADVLHLPDDNQTLLSAIAADQSFSPAANSGATVSQANGVWTQPGFDINSDYLATLRSAFGAAIQQADFSDPNTLKQINQFVADHTDNKIQNLFSQLDPSTILALVNAVYFDSNWASTFDPASDSSQSFTDDTGNSNTATFMHQTSQYQYYENDNLQLIEMPYANSDYEMTIVLPKSGGLSSIDSSLTPDNLAAWSAAATSTDVELSLPKFTMQTSVDLAQVLPEMGMTDAFNSSADFSGISPGLVISQAVHKAYVKVDEQGTEAAAATGITGIAAIEEPPPNVTVFDANHPFYVSINDVKTGATLFSGAMINPSD
jgi:serine protease inhibitor